MIKKLINLVNNLEKSIISKLEIMELELKIEKLKLNNSELKTRNENLTRALTDVVSCFGNRDNFVTEERVEAWQAALEQNNE